MNFVMEMKAKAISAPRRLVLPEGTEKRILRAARILLDERIAASVTLLGRAVDIQQAARTEGVDISGFNIISPAADSKLGKYADVYYELRKNKGLTPEQARIDITDVMRWGAMMVHLGDADAMVGGAERATSDVLRAGLSIIGTVPGLKTASSCFVMTGMDPQDGTEGSMIFSDCAVVPNPIPEQLADITVSAALSCREFLNTEPVVALLSFSTKGSATHDDVTKVQTAVSILKEKKVDFLFDGELQADAALVPSVLDKKAPGSPIRGRVNVLVFPDLNAGNIGYKLVQRLAKVQAFGPFLQGFAKPVSDLSRGASVDDIVITCAVTLSRVK
ncbi:MAG: phosphate acetyltransferase [Treponema sp.]|jgi:phosphate acetyltransferase|nr:phosphate acetyltransferase [Treponema sp.]